MKEQDTYYYPYVISQLRRIFNFDGNLRKREALLFAAGKQMGTYHCADCKALFPKHLVAVDHVEPVIPLDGFDNWTDVFKRLFWGTLQVLCKGKGSCHQRKTNRENTERRRLKRLREEQENE